MNFFSFNCPLREYFFCNPPPPHKFSKGPSLIRPLFDFADTIWGDRDHITLMRDLLVCQNYPWFVQLCFIYQRSEILGWSTLFQERLVHRYITTFKYIHGLADHNFNIFRNSDIHSYNTRRRNDFRLPLVKRN